MKTLVDAVKALTKIEDMFNELPDEVSKSDGDLNIAAQKAIILRQIGPLKNNIRLLSGGIS